MAYDVHREPTSSRYIVADPVRGVVPLLFTKPLVAYDVARLLNCIATCPPEDQALECLHDYEGNRGDTNQR
jgi:hypothetical protein